MPKYTKKAKVEAAGHEKNETTRTKVVFVDTAKAMQRSSRLSPDPVDVMRQASGLVTSELQVYSDSSRNIKDTIKRVVKNYLCIFDEPYDPYTNRKKIFTPLTHNIVDSVTKPVKVEASSIKIKPITSESRGAAKILNMVLPYFFQQMGFNEMMKLFTHRVGWLGHQVTIQDWLYEEREQGDEKDATTETKLGYQTQEYEKEETRIVVNDRPRVRLTDIMDIFCPANAESLPSAVRNASVILRSIVPLSDILGNPAYDDQVKSRLKGFTQQTSNEDDSSSLQRYALAGFGNGEVKGMAGQTAQQVNQLVAVYERYGTVPKSWLTKKEEDGLIRVQAIITCLANEGSSSTMEAVCIRPSVFGDYGPFEEAAYNKIMERWMGEGIGERLIPYQAWQNEVVNNRRNNELFVQHRMFLYRKGSVDPRYFFSRPGGGIPVENMGDVQALQFPDVSQSSFAEDSAIESAAQRLAGAAMTPIQKKVTAAESNNIQANSNLTYNELRDTIEGYVERLVVHHLLPMLKRYFTEKKSIPVRMSISELQVLDTYNGYQPFFTEQVGDERFLFIDDPSVFDGEFAVTVDIEATANRAQQAAAITNMISLGSKIQNSGINTQFALRKIAELSGVYDDRLYQDATSAMPTGVTSPQLQGIQPQQLAQQQMMDQQIPSPMQ